MLESGYRAVAMATRYLVSDPPRADDPLLGEIVRCLAAVYHPERIYLFGSVARGDAGPDSDYDLMVILPDDCAAELQSSERGYSAMRGLPCSPDVHVLTRRRFDRQLHLKASLPSTVLREGRLLHAA
jgi:hypothetical protein